MFVLFFSSFSCLLNLKQNQELIFRKKIKKFQLNFLRELLEAEEELNWEKYELELKSRKEEVRREIQKGLSEKFLQEEEG